jgi:membrane protease YdiL (CAAX protease family)
MGRETVAFLAVVAAPVFEEILFRGFVFRGMRQGMGFLPAAAASALIFAIVHPPEAVIPVFVLGAAAAWACEITGGLLAPVLAHAVYNAAVLVLQ